MKFNEELIRLRKEKGLSQEQLGYELGVTRQTISKWELGVSTPEMDKLIEISKLFNISLDDLVKNELNLKNKEEDVNMKGEFVERENKPMSGLVKVLIIVVIIGIIIGIIAGVVFGIQKYNDDKKEREYKEKAMEQVEDVMEKVEDSKKQVEETKNRLKNNSEDEDNEEQKKTNEEVTENTEKNVENITNEDASEIVENYKDKVNETIEDYRNQINELDNPNIDKEKMNEAIDNAKDTINKYTTENGVNTEELQRDIQQLDLQNHINQMNIR